jgi:hypothetical protein
MDKKVLVSIDIEAGKKLLEILDKTNMEITSAFWFYLSEIEEWRLILATKLVEKEGPRKAYTNLLENIGNYVKDIDIPLEAITLISPNDPLNLLLREAIQTGHGISGIRFSGNVINGILIKDSYLYRIN